MKRLTAAIAAAVLGISAQAGWKEGVNIDADGVRWNFRYDEEERVAYIQGAQSYGRTLRIPEKVSLGEVEYPVVLIEASAFSRFKDSLAATINNIVIPSSVSIIEQNAFEGCRSLTNLVIGSGVDEIDEEAFKDCFSLKEVTIPKNVTSLRARAFMDCTSLQDVSFDRNAGRPTTPSRRWRTARRIRRIAVRCGGSGRPPPASQTSPSTRIKAVSCMK